MKSTTNRQHLFKKLIHFKTSQYVNHFPKTLIVTDIFSQIIHSSCNESQREPPTEASPLLDNQTTLYYESRKHSSPSLSPPSRKIWSYAVICILFTELCERLTFHAILGNLELFAAGENQLNYALSDATVISDVFLGV